MTINEDDKETVDNGLLEAGLESSHLVQLEKSGILFDHFVDDCTLHISLKNTFLSKKQMGESKKNQITHTKASAKCKSEETKQKHAEKCVKMHDKLLKALKPFADLSKECLHNSILSEHQVVYAYNHAKITMDDLRLVENVFK